MEPRGFRYSRPQAPHTGTKEAANFLAGHRARHVDFSRGPRSEAFSKFLSASRLFDRTDSVCWNGFSHRDHPSPVSIIPVIGTEEICPGLPDHRRTRAPQVWRKQIDSDIGTPLIALPSTILPSRLCMIDWQTMRNDDQRKPFFFPLFFLACPSVNVRERARTRTISRTSLFVFYWLVFDLATSRNFSLFLELFLELACLSSPRLNQQLTKTNQFSDNSSLLRENIQCNECDTILSELDEFD